MHKSLTFVIPNYNGQEILKKNLPAIAREAERYNAQVIVVDDASKDQSVTMLRQDFSTIQLIEQPVNQGFSSTVNAGVQAAQTELVCLLNSDVIPQPDFLAPAFHYFEDDKIAAVGLQDLDDQEDQHGRGSFIFHQGFILHKKHPEGAATPGQTAWVSGGSGIFSKKIWNQLAGLDTLLNPFYFEDVDYGYRAWKSGYTMYFEPQAQVRHLHQQGAIKSNYDQKKIKTISYRNQCLVSWKNLTDNSYLSQHHIGLLRTIGSSLKNNDQEFLRGLGQAITKLPAVLQKRSQVSKHFVLTDAQLFTKFK